MLSKIKKTDIDYINPLIYLRLITITPLFTQTPTIRVRKS